MYVLVEDLLQGLYICEFIWCGYRLDYIAYNDMMMNDESFINVTKLTKVRILNQFK